MRLCVDLQFIQSESRGGIGERLGRDQSRSDSIIIIIVIIIIIIIIKHCNVYMFVDNTLSVSQVENVKLCPIISSLHIRRPFDRGYIVSLDVIKPILDRVLLHHLKLTPSRARIIVSDVIFNLLDLQRSIIEVGSDWGASRPCDRIRVCVCVCLKKSKKRCEILSLTLLYLILSFIVTMSR